MTPTTPIFDDLREEYFPPRSSRRRPTPLERFLAALPALALATSAGGLLIAAVRNPGMALVTALIMTVGFWAVTQILRGRS